MDFLHRLFRFLISVKFAVVVVLALAASLAVATVVESVYDTATGQYWVYRSFWFYALLAVFGLLIFLVAMSRYPWKRSQAPFLTAHLGILVLLAGSWMTDRKGLDGSLRISEGEVSAGVDLSNHSLYIADSKSAWMIPIQWIPPNKQFETFSIKDHGVDYEMTVDQYISRSEAVTGFVSGGKGHAIKLRIAGGPMGINQDFWLWEGDPSSARMALGPARFSLGPDPTTKETKTTRIEILPRKDGDLDFVAHSLRGNTVRGRIGGESWKNQVIEPDWKGVRLTVLEWVKDAKPSTTYKPSRFEYGMGAPPPAIHLSATEKGKNTSVWLGLGDRAVVHYESGDVTVAFYPQQVKLPFSIRLERFTIEHYEGTRDPAAYSSRVTVLPGSLGGEPFETVISMNEPLEYAGYRLYQASYEDAQPRPITSIFSVNRDPGRAWKYIGSILIVLGSIMLFVSRYKRSKSIAEAVKI